MLNKKKQHVSDSKIANGPPFVIWRGRLLIDAEPNCGKIIIANRQIII